MSVAEDLRRPFEAPAPRDPSERQRWIDLPRSVAGTVKDRREPPRPALELASPTDLANDSFELIDRASKGVVHVLARYRQLEEHVRQLDAWSKTQIAAAEATAARWQEAAAETERKVQEAQQTLAAMTRRAEEAERDLKRDKEALAGLQERILAAFGFGSEAHDVLASIDQD